MAHYTHCPRCNARYDVTTVPDGTTFVCDECGFDVTVTYEVENKIPGGLTVKTKVLGDGTKWLECPKCQMSTEITKISPGNRFRCQRCNLLLQVPVERKPVERKTRSIRAEHILTCPSCKTKYDVSGYTPGNRFRCRSCSLTLTVPAPTDWTGTGDWEIDVEKGVIQCNGCGMSFPMAEYVQGAAFQCRNCQKSFTPSVDLGQLVGDRAGAAGADRADGPETKDDGGEGWDHNPDTGMATCRSCGYAYDVSGMKPGADFVCPRCEVVFKMPATVPEDGLRERVVCQNCNEAYDVSGYLRGTMFTCQKCDAVILVGRETVRETLATLAEDESAAAASMTEASPAPETTQTDGVPAAQEAESSLDDTTMTAGRAAAPETGTALGDEAIFDGTESGSTGSPDGAAKDKVLLVCSECDQSYLVPRAKDNLKRKCKLCSGLLKEKGAGEGPEARAEEVTEEHFERIAAVVEEVQEIDVAPGPSDPAPADEKTAPVEEEQPRPKKKLKKKKRKKAKKVEDAEDPPAKAGKTKKKLGKKKKKAGKTRRKGKA